MSTKDMLVDSMTKNMRDILLTELMFSGAWCPLDYELYVASDHFYIDPVANCVQNGCYCMKSYDHSVAWWHLPVAEPEPEGEPTNAEDTLDIFHSTLWWCAIDE